ncbi:uncharacterized protein LOC141720333 [Apium graveolens]|uniref:uncharacterized protein LOC141720333 n=1 Tax=Apium graveolens TaxID=4045 RepID=UPI003D7BDD16
MSERQINQTFYDYRKKVISWTIEWRFHSTDVVLRNHGVDDNTSLSSAIMNHLKPGPFNHQLKRFCEEPLHSLNFFIRKFQHSKSPFVQLDIEAPICEQLANLDYNLLEDVKRVAESAQRKRANLCGDSEKLPFPLKSLY